MRGYVEREGSQKNLENGGDRSKLYALFVLLRWLLFIRETMSSCNSWSSEFAKYQVTMTLTATHVDKLAHRITKKKGVV